MSKPEIDRSVASRHASRILDAYLDTWPPEEAAMFAANFRRFVQDGPFRP